MLKKINLELVKKIRRQTGAGVMEIKQALEAAQGNQAEAKKILKKKGLEKALQRQDKAAEEGQVFSYVHPGSRVAAMVKLLCETDFVARSAEFQQLGKELAMQIASMEPKTVKELLSQPYIREPEKTVKILVMETAAKVKEKIEVAEISRLSV